ncbi:MAG: hypothetical protein J6U28_08765 [Bacteroidales bacterium]|nr:hypothetical protein [Bacteroidales bacterium]
MFTVEHSMKVVDHDQLEKELNRAELIYDAAKVLLVASTEHSDGTVWSREEAIEHLRKVLLNSGTLSVYDFLYRAGFWVGPEVNHGNNSFSVDIKFITKIEVVEEVPE